MSDQYTRARAAADFIRSRFADTPVLGIILGSGLGNFATHVENAIAIAYSEIPGWPLSTVVGHSGKLVLGTIGGVCVAVMQGRVHAYEGYSMAEVTFPTRVLGLLGCTKLIVTNAAGGINASYSEGTLVNITDHINLTGTNAALGPNEPRFGLVPGTGERFFDMSTAYSPRFRSIAHAEAESQQINLRDGVYLAVLGPSFETPAEIRAFRTLGADLVGMSTVHEVIVARHMGMEVLGFSLVTNMAAGVVDKTIHHEDVMEIGKRVEAEFTTLLKALIPQIAQFLPPIGH
ncbi:purine-nucleoside phosphorylase [Granulicella sp. 5B5]|uniref:purine-nucleoside phosphorylase n=1 Tax=Granulicella sp. 5B5 TaxID=1617967 RepID=UPI0015F7547A|nr:purine-nucleoside phosphorylase [Granulicella sp. 5B5]QMV17837.1 purine-nucleoside phosphorylase [Granulicella sp. 5B5]